MSSYYSSIEVEAVSLQLVRVWFEDHKDVRSSLSSITEDADLVDTAPEVADEVADEIFGDYDAATLAALRVTSDDLYVAIAHIYGF